MKVHPGPTDDWHAVGNRLSVESPGQVCLKSILDVGATQWYCLVRGDYDREDVDIAD